MMAAKDLDTAELLESTPPTTPTETRPDANLSPGKKKPGPCILNQAADFVQETNKSIDRFLKKMRNYKPYAIEEAYKVLIAEYHYTNYVALRITLKILTRLSYWILLTIEAARI